MNPILTLVQDRLSDSLLVYADVMGRTLAATVRRAAKGVTRRVIDITPPASEGMKGAAAYRQGRVRIANQMNAVLAPVKLKGRRRITQVFGHTPKRAIFVPTRERHPDVARLYREQLRAVAGGAGFRLRKYSGKKSYVDIRKFQAVLKVRQSHVGRLASGWAAASAALDVPLQNWIGRHGRSRGAVKLDLMSSRMRVVVTNLGAAGLPDKITGELRRRISYAVQYQREAMAREVRYMMGKKAQELAIKTRNFDNIVPTGMEGGGA